ncbi:MAG: hypothetical protein U9O96_07975 [Candidatus Thermoplasmatota archaeon]|nr:hypothetical protein [Candidatus Thermoplasmatota archaeon]
MQAQDIAEMKKDIEKLKEETERLKLLFEDAILSKEEVNFVEKTIVKLKEGDRSEFVNIDELDEI